MYVLVDSDGEIRGAVSERWLAVAICEAWTNDWSWEEVTAAGTEEEAREMGWFPPTEEDEAAEDAIERGAGAEETFTPVPFGECARCGKVTVRQAATGVYVCLDCQEQAAGEIVPVGGVRTLEPPWPWPRPRKEG